MGKKLSDEDKAKIVEYARKHADPTMGKVAGVTVADELTDNGTANYTILYMQEKEMPKGWKP